MNTRRWTAMVPLLFVAPIGCAQDDDSMPGVYALGSSASDTEGDGTPDTDSGGTDGTSTGDLPMFTAGTPQTSAASLTMAPTTMDSGASDTDGGDTDSDDTQGASSTGTPQELPCDPGWVFDPAVPTTAEFFVDTTHEDPLPYIDLQMVGANEPTIEFIDVVAEDPWMWRFRVTGHAPGHYELAFGNADSQGGAVTVRSRCEIEIAP